MAVDFHVHSSYSGGSLSPQEIVKYAQANLLDAIAISDHEQVAGSLEAERFAFENSGSPLIITSQEISAGDHFHLVTVGAREVWNCPNRNVLLDKVRQHKAAGGAVILAHPWTIPKKTGWAQDFLKELLATGLVDGVEMFNSSILDFNGEAEAISRSVWENIIAPYQPGVVGGSDFHYTKQRRFIGSGRTYLKITKPGAEGIIEALRNRQTVAGLFSYRPFDLGVFGSGYNAIFGLEPWAGELRRMIEDIRRVIPDLKIGPNTRRMLESLLAAGHYQYVWDYIYR